MSRRTVTILAAVAAAAFGAAPTAVAATPAQRGVHYLVLAQNADGGFGFSPKSTSTGIATQWAALGLAAAGSRPSHIRRPGGRTLADAVARGAATAREASDLERAILALRASRRSTANAARRLAGMQQRDGSFDHLVTTTAFGVFALRAAGRPARDRGVRRATAYLRRQQNRDGSFSAAGRGSAGGVDETAAGIQALLRGGLRRTAAPVRRAIGYLRAQQQPDGGFPLRRSAPSNAQSTAWATQAFVAAGVNPSRVRRGGSRDPLAFLRSLQASDGSFRYSRTSTQTPVWVTSQALMALARKAF